MAIKPDPRISYLDVEDLTKGFEESDNKKESLDKAIDTLSSRSIVDMFSKISDFEHDALFRLWAIYNSHFDLSPFEKEFKDKIKQSGRSSDIDVDKYLTKYMSMKLSVDGRARQGIEDIFKHDLSKDEIKSLLTK